MLGGGRRRLRCAPGGLNGPLRSGDRRVLGERDVRGGLHGPRDAGHQGQGSAPLGAARRGAARRARGGPGLGRAPGVRFQGAGGLLPARLLPRLLPAPDGRHDAAGELDDQEDHAHNLPRRPEHHALGGGPDLVLLPRGDGGDPGGPGGPLVDPVRRGAALPEPGGALGGGETTLRRAAGGGVRGVRARRRVVPRGPRPGRLRAGRLARYVLDSGLRLPGPGGARRLPDEPSAREQDSAVAGLRLLARSPLAPAPPRLRAPLGGDTPPRCPPTSPRRARFSSSTWPCASRWSPSRAGA